MRRALLVAAALVTALVVLFVLPLLRDPGIGQTSYSTRPSGFRAVRELAQMQGVEVGISRAAPRALDREHRTLLMLQPLGNMLEQEGYQERLLEWVEAGHRLVVVPRSYETQVSRMLGQVVETRVAEPGGVDAVQALLERAGLNLSVQSGSAHESEPKLELQNGESYRTRLGFELHLSWDGDAWETLASVEDRVVGARAEFGAGEVIVFTEAALFSNFQLARLEHAAAAVALLRQWSHGGLVFDEFFHGLPSIDSFLDLLTSPKVLPLTLLLLALLVACLAAGVVRWRPIQVQEVPSRRSKREHLIAMGQLIARGRRGPWAYLATLEGVHADLAAAFGLPRATSAEVLQARLHHVNPEFAQTWRELRQQACDWKTLPGREELLQWARSMLNLRRRVLERHPLPWLEPYR